MAPQLLHQGNPTMDPLMGNVRATRDDWLNTALDVLKGGSVGAIKIAEQANRMWVSRSSFFLDH